MSAPSRTPSAWIHRYHPVEQAEHRLVCFPHAGGSANYFFPVAKALSPDIDVLALQYPGRQDRRNEPCIEDIDTLADHVTEELRNWRDRPLTFFGHSMGASLAFEVARRLERDDVVLTALFASGRRAPSRHRDERTHLLGDADLLAEVRKLDGTDGTMLQDDEIVRMVLPAIRGDYKAAETYRYVQGPDVSSTIVALIGDADPKATIEEAESWADHTSGAFHMHVFPGGHFYLNHHQTDVLKLITEHVTGR